MVKTLHERYCCKYPPGRQEEATEAVLEQPDSLSPSQRL